MTGATAFFQPAVLLADLLAEAGPPEVVNEDPRFNSNQPFWMRFFNWFIFLNGRNKALPCAFFANATFLTIAQQPSKGGVTGVRDRGFRRVAQQPAVPTLQRVLCPALPSSGHPGQGLPKHCLFRRQTPGGGVYRKLLVHLCGFIVSGSPLATRKSILHKTSEYRLGMIGWVSAIFVGALLEQILHRQASLYE